MPIQVVNVIPRARSGETQQDSEPNLAVNPQNPQQLAISAFTFDSSAGPNRAPIYVSNDGGNSWVLTLIVPSPGQTLDISLAFAGAGGMLYAGIIPNDPDPTGTLPPRLNIVRTQALFGPNPMAVLVDRRGAGVDQPYVEAITPPAGTQAGLDVVFVASNDFNQPNRRTATADYSRNGAGAANQFRSASIDARPGIPNGQDAPSVRPAIHMDGTVYGAFLHQISRTADAFRFAIYNVVVVRDDQFAQTNPPFAALQGPGGVAGQFVATNRVIPFLPARPGQPGPLGQERIGSHLAICVDRRDGQSGTVYIAWADLVSGPAPARPAYTIHLRRSTDRGQTWSNDLLTIPNAINPALAINSDGKVGFLYQQLSGIVTLGVVSSTNRWQTHFRRSVDGVQWDDTLLATVAADTPTARGLPYLGDYIRLLAVERDFYGVFCAANRPDRNNFPQGVRYQRNANFNSRRLLALDNATRVPISIDPFFFKATD
jgi:hypothetical protein